MTPPAAPTPALRPTAPGIPANPLGADQPIHVVVDAGASLHPPPTSDHDGLSGGVGVPVPSTGLRSTCSSLGDCALLPLVASGDVPALTALLDRHRPAAIVVAARICGSPLAEEAVQEAFLQISRASGRYRPELGPVRSWLLGIVRHRAIDALRVDARHAHRRADVDGLALLPCADDVPATVHRRDDARTVRELLQTLPGDQARVIAMAYFDELTHVEIAILTGLPVGTVKGRIRLGLAKLRRSMSPDAIPASAT